MAVPLSTGLGTRLVACSLAPTGEIIEVISPSSYLIEVNGARKVYHVNDLRKYHIRIDYALCDNMCIGMPQNYSCTNTGTVNTCAVVYEKMPILDESHGSARVL